MKREYPELAKYLEDNSDGMDGLDREDYFLSGYRLGQEDAAVRPDTNAEMEHLLECFQGAVQRNVTKGGHLLDHPSIDQHKQAIRDLFKRHEG